MEFLISLLSFPKFDQCSTNFEKNEGLGAKDNFLFSQSTESKMLQQHLRQTLDDTRACRKRRRRVSCPGRRFWGVVGLGAVVIAGFIFLLLQKRLLGDGPTLQGGSLGRRIDNTHKRWIFTWRDWQYRRSFYQETGRVVPPCPESKANAFGVPVLLSTFLTESIRRATQRQRLQRQLSTSCPQCLFVPLLPNWYQPFHANVCLQMNVSKDPGNSCFIVMPFQESEMELLLRKHSSETVHAQTVLRLSQSWKNSQDRARLWGIFMVYQYSGAFTEGQQSQSSPASDDGSPSWRIQDQRLLSNNKTHAFVWQAHVHEDEVLLYASQPHIWELECLFGWLTEQYDDNNNNPQHEFPQLEIAHVWAYLQYVEDCKQHLAPEAQKSQCCLKGEDEKYAGYLEKELNINAKTTSTVKPNNGLAIASIQEIEKSDSTTPKPSQKISHAAQLHNKECAPGWFCNRCLKMPWYGTLESCRPVCRSCYIAHMTHDSTSSLAVIRFQVTLPLHAQGQHRIPRIIHQTWFEDLTTANYPHLTRLQNSWKASGWEYRFYTDSSARLYVQKHFPRPFLEAYDAILPGAFKADFFRLLALLREGGIYADVDVQLDATDLDNFVPPDVSFFVPRDVPLDRWPDSNYCLWNGLMGAAPGHPFIVQAVEDLLNRALNRWDYYDVENSICTNNADCQIWRLRSIPVLILTGPCALGISVNTVLGRADKTHGFDLGWLPSPKAHKLEQSVGDGLVFLTDRYDMGELRFSDVDRGLLIASTNADQFASSPIFPSNHSSVHYSKSETDIMGSSGMYIDDLVVNQRFELIVEYRGT